MEYFTNIRNKLKVKKQFEIKKIMLRQDYQ